MLSSSKKLRKYLTFALLVFLSCSSKKQEGIVFWHAMGGPLGDALKTIVNWYSQTNPPITLVNLGNYNTLSQKIMGAVASNTPPTASQLYESWASELLSAKKIIPIQNYLNLIDSTKLKNVFEVLITGNKWQDTLVTFPFNKSVPVFYYNIDLFEKYGIKEFPKTWDEFREVAKKLTIDENGDGQPEIYGTAFTIDVWIFATILYQKGGRLLEGDSVMFDSPEGIEALTFLQNLIFKDKCAYLGTGYSHQDDFANGRVAMIWGTIVSYAFIKDKINFRLGVAPVPIDKYRTVIISGTNVGIFVNVPESHKKNFINFLNFFLEDSVQAYWSSKTGYLPLTKSAFEHPTLKNFVESVTGLKEAMLQVEYGDYEPRDPVWFTGRRILSEEGIEPALRGHAKPEESLKRAADLIRQEIARRKSYQIYRHSRK
uniref:ABC transporter substrate-binding protein n=1 Tax=candidate division WOR-3 bacterium TaxID=2052148 RepID=A0A7V3ZXP8_UNCW3